MAIQRLDDLTIGKIAAGEIIERPASIVKELIENSLDAEASSIQIELVAGGRELIRVADDGIGIRPEDFPLAVERHATSKLHQFEDLSRLHSYGFRGEALASIASVSDLTIVSRQATASHGMSLRTNGLTAPILAATAASPGTVTAVRDLFAEVPARRKFLRQDQTEASYAQRVVVAYALAHPEVRFELTLDGRTALLTDGSGDLGNAIVAVFGTEAASRMLPIVAEPPDGRDDSPVDADGALRPAVEVDGWISLPSLTRGNRQQIILLVNGRWIESRSLSFALEQAYHSLIMVGRFPIAVINIVVQPDRLDVNVHPTKREVRFSDERLVFATLQRAVRATLVGATPQQPIPSIEHAPMAAPEVQRRLSLAHPGQSYAHPPDHGETSMSSTDQLPSEEQTMSRTGTPLRVLGQVGASYIIAEGPDGMYLIDQHAAHERVLFEKLWTRYEQSTPDAQQMLEPLVVELTPPQLDALEASTEDLTRLGFLIEPFGGGSVAIRAVPAILLRRDPKRVLVQILDEMSQGGRGTTRLESLVITTACHSAIRAGQQLSLAEMRELIIQLEGCTAPRACGHGRPTMLHLSQDELERQFERR
ncbi:MAG TPA: DNA mismatch repair endonuclease MutL [Thermomicrobiaceae bacterium]|nr:DNA mismatch repair endonuclease MutL [Thermomicrobiaceae bacterium]